MHRRKFGWRLLGGLWLSGLVLVVLLCFSALGAYAGHVLNDALVTRPFRHHIWQDVLNQNMDASGTVNFTRLRAHPKRLNQYLQQLASTSPENHPEFFPTPNDRLAYWINAHNALALRVVLDHYPTDSLANVPDFETNAFYLLGGKPYSLAAIRLHIAPAYALNPDVLYTVTDYTKDSPPILPQAYEGEYLSGQIQQAKMLARAEGVLFTVNRENPACLGLDVSPFLKSFAPILLKPEADWAIEDRDVMGEPNEKPMPAPTWLERLRPLTSPAVYADLGLRCPHEVRFRPSDRTLRQVRDY
jgi:hypothetical protein